MTTTRKHLFEIEDQRWFPQTLRRMVTDVLQHQLIRTKMYSPLVPKIKEAMTELGCNQFVDLCSGSGGPLPQLQQELLKNQGFATSSTLTDKYPDEVAVKNIERMKNVNAKYLPNSIDATAVPADLKGFRTLFTSFHHFEPTDAKAILHNAVKSKEGIGIFEFTERSRFMLLKSIFPLIAVLVTTPFIRPFRWDRLFFTYIVPIIPIAFFWDALASNYRTYSPQELTELFGSLGDTGYKWDVGKIEAAKPIWNLTYLIGVPIDNPERVGS